MEPDIVERTAQKIVTEYRVLLDRHRLGGAELNPQPNLWHIANALVADLIEAEVMAVFPDLSSAAARRACECAVLLRVDELASVDR